MSQYWSPNGIPSRNPRHISPRRHHHHRQFNNEFLRDPPPGQTDATDGRSNYLPIFYEIRTVIVVLKVLGLLPLWQQVSAYEIAPPSRGSELYSFVVRCILHACTIFGLYVMSMPGASYLVYAYSDTDNINQWIEIVISIINYTVTIFLCGRNSKTLVLLINEILQVDEEIQRIFAHKISNECGFTVKFIVLTVFCQAYIITLRYFYGAEMDLNNTLITFLYSSETCISSVIIIFAAAMLHIIKMRFAYINNLLDSYTYVTMRKMMLRQQQKQQHRRIGDAMLSSMEKFPDDSLFAYRMHNKLLRIYRLMNECSSLILVSHMGYAFYTITTTAYNLFIQITTQGELSAAVFQWCVSWLILHTGLLTLLSRKCGQASREVGLLLAMGLAYGASANTTAQILARIYGKNKEYQNIIDKFLTKSIKQEVQFTAYGFFVIDNSTLFKIFSAVTTYLVILIQFKQLEDSKNEELALKAEREN